MKFLHDAALAALTSELTDARLPGGGSGRPGRRALHGRIEAYTTKRAGTDKRVAHALGERYLMELRKDEVAEEEYRAAQRERLRRMFGDVDGGGAAEGSSGAGMSGGGNGGAVGQGEEEAEKEDAAPRAVLPPSALYGLSASPPESWGFNMGSSSSSSQKDSGRSPKSVRIVSNDRSAGGNGNGGNSGGGGRSGSDESGNNGGRRVTGSKKSKPGGSRAGRRRRSQSIDVPSLSSKRLVSNDDNKNDDEEGAEGEVASGDGKAHGGSDGRRSGGGRQQRRARASSFDAAAVERAKRGTDKGGGSGSGRPLSEKERKSREKFEAKFGRAGRNKQGRSPPRRSYDLARSPLGDFHEPPARRLMTDLVLTLNASFPDYDFGDYVRPRHFVRLGSPRHAVARVNERLGEYAATSAPSWRGGGGVTSGVGLPGGAPSSAAVDADAYFAVGFLQKLWSSIDAVFGGGLKDCEVYSYAPGSDDQDGDDDPLGFLSQTLAGREEVGDGGGIVGAPGVDAGAGGVAGGGGGKGGDIVPLWTFNYFFVSRAMKRIVFFACVQTVNTEEEGASADDEEETTPYSYPAVMAGRREDRREEAEEMKMMDMVAPLPHFRAGHGAPLAGGDAASVGATSASGYYSISSSNAASDVDFDMDGDGMAKDVPENDVTAAATARRVVSA